LLKIKNLSNFGKMASMSEQKKAFINPIDPDKITENPHSLEYGHHVGSAVVKPEDQGRLKGLAVSAMEQQTDQQLGQIYEQMQLLADQAKKIQARKEISERIYLAEIRFTPIISHVYHLYKKDDGKFTLSLIAPEQWGRSGAKFEFVATVRLLPDHTWDIIARNEEIEI
jgi:3-dehydroquinate synthetase